MLRVDDVICEALERLGCSFSWISEEKNGKVYREQSYLGGVSPEGYSKRVYLSREENGKKVEDLWCVTYNGRKNTEVKGDVFPVLEISEIGLSIVLKKFNYREVVYGHDKPPLSVERICALSSIKKVEFWTTSGWNAECYPERQGEKEDSWVIILHRSTGAVSIHRDISSLPWYC